MIYGGQKPKEAIKIKVGRKHIANGIKEDAEYCPIALAMQGAGLKLVDVQPENATYYRDSYYHNVPLPVEAKIFVNEFDSGKNVMPFEFVINEAKGW